MTIILASPWITVGPPVAASPEIAALWSSADLLKRCRFHSRRPETDQTMPETAWYDLLTEAQAEVYPALFSRFPWAGYADPKELTSEDGGLTYGFGLDLAGEEIRPHGHAELYPSMEAIPDDPLIEGEDFIAEGDQIRMLGRRARAFPRGIVARLILEPEIPISAAYEPLLFPKPARMLLVWKALEGWASRPGSGVDPSQYEARYLKLLPETYNDFATAYNRGGGGGRTWYTGFDLGSQGLNR